MLSLRAASPRMTHPLHNSHVSSVASCLFTSTTEEIRLDFTQEINWPPRHRGRMSGTRWPPVSEGTRRVLLTEVPGVLASPRPRAGKGILKQESRTENLHMVLEVEMKSHI